MDDELTRTLAGVGQRLRALRTRRDLTLSDVSRDSGISVSTLSRLESGARRPALELLLPLARVYDVPLDELVGAPEAGDPRVHIRRIPHRGGVMMPLGRGSSGIRVVKQILPPPRPGERVELKTHRGNEWLYVISGRLRLVLADRDFVLEAGEAAEFDTRTPHWIGAADDAGVELLHLSGPEGQRIHMPEL
ncbi:helix-turn-helix domain-containing protein [Homoserinibacter sp. GY 40078]|uniref:helix-turn-helix domain-containing protein n=1 Tax=Homoserinibacter sp. GY 40078 TaxID=2603275 RepID=UPI0011CA08A9|nr:helix-turn-helix domain-containing protein [Homoserinibacter sp. GY 40078]TXK19676.1 helix-turn-helix domain-containing protein [Homoserinibacter sp. GY 40078]